MNINHRRGFLRGLTSLPLVGGAGITAASAGPPDAELNALSARLTALWEIERGLTTSELDEYDDHPAVAEAFRIVDDFAGLHARTLPGLCAKARAILWCYSGEREEVLGCLVDEEASTTDHRLLASILRDLLDMVDADGRAFA